ncbi:oxidoreductase [Tsuneonella amylolytica]|uniref:oxidoreductase n=1 Tax=Tsuneonella amylolytica TaxID=2338327 RepID=UPI000EA8F6AC|nr:oxidoreductase [Tsuneonella amylolytica]
MNTPQQPVGSPFGYRSTAREAMAGQDLTGRRIVVTGGYSGIGTETVRALAGAGAEVIVGARRVEAAEGVLAGIGGSVAILPLDLSDPASIDAFADAVANRWDALDILINNAAVMASPLTRDARGYEGQFATNHLGHFQLTARLWSLLATGGHARVVALSSIGHRLGAPDLDDPNFERRDYDKWQAYGQAKSANALFALYLDRLGEPHGVRAFSVHPGGIMTPLQRHLSREEQVAMGWIDADGNVNERFKTTEQGAATTVWAATSPLLEGKGGVYCEDCDVAAPASADRPTGGVHPHLRDEGLAERLWALSEEMTGVRFRP